MGRPKGSKNKKTLEKEKQLKESTSTDANTYAQSIKNAVATVTAGTEAATVPNEAK